MTIRSFVVALVALAIAAPRIAMAATITDADHAQLERLYRAQVAIGKSQASMLSALHADLLAYAPQYFKASQVPALHDTGNTERNIAAVLAAADFLFTGWGTPASSTAAMYEVASQLADDDYQPQLPTQSYLDNVASPLGDPVSILGFGYGIAPDRVSVEIRNVLIGSAAQSAGVDVGDRLIAIDGIPVTTDLSKIGAGLRASAMPKVTLSRGGVNRDVMLERTMVRAPTVYVHLVDTIAVARLTGIGSQTAGELAAAMSAAPYANAKGLVLDLRATHAGTYEEAVAFASLFAPAGTVLGTRQRSTAITKLYATAGARLTPMPVVLLVGYFTQGSVEFTAALLRRFSHAKLVGEYTRNVPLAVRRFQFDDGSGTLLEDGGLYLPGDHGALDGPDDKDRALKPDVILKEPDTSDILNSADPDRDPQLRAALALAH